MKLEVNFKFQMPYLKWKKEWKRLKTTNSENQRELMWDEA